MWRTVSWLVAARQQFTLTLRTVGNLFFLPIQLHLIIVGLHQSGCFPLFLGITVANMKVMKAHHP